MNKEHRFTLESKRVTGHRQQKHLCPQCGKRRFVRYVDTEDNCSYLANDVGRCDRINNCGYHYTPAQYFHDHPWLSEPKQSLPHPAVKPKPATPKPVFQPLVTELVLTQHSPQSTFWQWFSTSVRQKLNLSDDDVNRIYRDYMPGATRQSDVIFWQIDEEQRVHTGHIMQYGPDGHRLSYNGWEHDRLQREGLLKPGYVPVQCLFGQHLLSRYPGRDVCLVESEKTAIILAARHPQQIWLATSGCEGLSTMKVACLRGRRVFLFPDSGCYAKWLAKMQQTTGIAYTVSDELEQYPLNTDLADLLLGEA